MRTAMSLVLCAMLVIGVAQSVLGENSVVVESKTVLPGETGVVIPIRLTNDVELNQIAIPLVAREITPGAFMTSVAMAWDDRLYSGGPLNFIREMTQWETWGGGCSWSGTIYHPSGSQTVGSSPEGLLFAAAGMPTDNLVPGSDASGSLVLTMDMSTVAGSFEIDTTCHQTAGSINFTDEFFVWITPSFTKGSITIEPPREPDWVQYYDGSASGHDQAAEIEVDAAGNMYVTGTSEGHATAECETQVWTDDTIDQVLSDDGADPTEPFVRFTATDACTLKEARFLTYGYSGGSPDVRVRVYGNDGFFWGRWYPDIVSEGANFLGSIEIPNGNLEVFPNWNIIDLTGLGPLTFEAGERFFISVARSPLTPAGEVDFSCDDSGAPDSRSGYYIEGGGFVYFDDQMVGLDEWDMAIEATICYEGTRDDYATVKYDADGNEQWVRRHDGSSHSNDAATALAMDASGNIYVTGYAVETGASRELTTIKYWPDGDTAWVNRYGAFPNKGDWGEDIAVNAAGYACVTGTTQDDTWDQDIITVKYDTDGDTLWARRYAGPWNEYDHGYATAIDDAGNVYVGGTVGHSSFDDFVTIKYDAAGNEEWAMTYNGTANQSDRVTAIAVDGLGNVYVTGSSTETGTFEDFCTIKYDSDGNTVWDRRYGGGSIDNPKALVVDDGGNVYVTGFVNSSDIGTIKYSPAGDLLAEHQYDGPPTGGSMDMGLALALGSAGNVYVTGYVDGPSEDCVTLTYDSDLVLRDEWFFDAPSGGDGQGVDVVVDGSGNVIVGGYCENTPDGNDYFVLKYESTCSCPFQRDYDEDTFPTALDLGFMIATLFEGRPTTQDPGCPTVRSDVDCDGFPTALDLGILIAELFESGPGPCDPCVTPPPQ